MICGDVLGLIAAKPAGHAIEDDDPPGVAEAFLNTTAASDDEASATDIAHETRRRIGVFPCVEITRDQRRPAETTP